LKCAGELRESSGTGDISGRIYSNVLFRPVVNAAFGFSCLLQEGDLLFDTGGDGRILLQNLSSLQIDPLGIQAIVLSHDHADHTGGLEALLSANPGISVFIHEGFSKRTRAFIREYGTPRMIRGWQEITGGYSPLGHCRIAFLNNPLRFPRRGDSSSFAAVPTPILEDPPV
jgi:glyoxylase-like metal-dependent hydrolase (beta-lactamase superfamily II)